MAKWIGAHYNQKVRFSSAERTPGPNFAAYIINDEIINIIIITY